MRALSAIAALGLSLAVVDGQTDSRDFQRYQQQIQENPANSRAHYELAEIYLQLDDYQTAAHEYRAALNGDLEPKLIEVLSHLGLAKVFDLTNQPERAADERRQAARAGERMTGRDAVAAAAQDPLAALSNPPVQTATPPSAIAPLHLTPIMTPIHQAAAEYSEEARAAGLEGMVLVTVNVAADGTPVDADVQSPLGLGLDEHAVAAARQWRFTPPVPATANSTFDVPIHFLLPAKLSRWHLVRASFQAQEGVTRPAFLTEPYPLGPGVSNKAIDEGWVISSIPRAATVTLQFDINERGVPTKFHVLAASAELWGDEAIAVVRPWRFKPGMKDGHPIVVPCTLALVWGQKVWTADTLAKVHESTLIAATNPPGPTKPKITFTDYLDDPQKPHNELCVILRATVGEDGKPTDIQVVRTLGYAYNSAAIDAIRSWHLFPAFQNGKPVSMTRLIEIDFAPTQ